MWSRSEQKNAKIPPPLSATTKLDFVFTRPRPVSDWAEQAAGPGMSAMPRKRRRPEKGRPVVKGQQQTHAAQQINFIIRSPRRPPRAACRELGGRALEASNKPKLHRVITDNEHNRDAGSCTLSREQTTIRVRRLRPLEVGPDQPPNLAVGQLGFPPSDIRSPRSGLQRSRIGSNLAGAGQPEGIGFPATLQV